MIIDPSEDALPPDSDAAAFYAQLGKAIAQWARVESSVFELFAFALVIDRYKAAMLFEKIGQIKARIEITDSLLSVSVSKKWYDKWKPLSKKLHYHLPFRNHLAHNPVDKIAVSHRSGDKSFRYFSHTATGRISKKENFVAGIKEISDHNEAIGEIIACLSNVGVPARARRRPSVPTPLRFPQDMAQANPQASRLTLETQRLLLHPLQE